LKQAGKGENSRQFDEIAFIGHTQRPLALLRTASGHPLGAKPALTKNGKSPGSAGGLEKFDISGSPSGSFKP
jgi:hypothetical protein